MRSSEHGGRDNGVGAPAAWRPARRLLLAATVLGVAACASHDACEVRGAPGSSPDLGAEQAVLRSIRNGSLYAQAIAPTGVAACRLARDDGVLRVHYRASGGNALDVERDPRIEYTNVEASFVTPPVDNDAIGILARAERESFGAGGCGIDWLNPETEKSADAQGNEESIYRGDVCNCRARVRRNAAGVVIKLGLRSSC